jgi:hypothetical protein
LRKSSKREREPRGEPDRTDGILFVLLSIVLVLMIVIEHSEASDARVWGAHAPRVLVAAPRRNELWRNAEVELYRK